MESGGGGEARQVRGNFPKVKKVIDTRIGIRFSKCLIPKPRLIVIRIIYSFTNMIFIISNNLT